MPPVTGRRIGALAVDYLVSCCWAGILALGALTVRAVRGGLPDVLGTLGPAGTQGVFFLLLTFVIGCYLYLTESGEHSATWGKRRLRLRVTAAGGDRPGRASILIRTAVKLAPWELAHTFVWQLLWFQHQYGTAAAPPGWIMAGLIGAMVLAVIWLAAPLLTGRGVHDRLARTTVVDGRQPA
jgi:uncharacterized RDD family membrane protein YckC